MKRYDVLKEIVEVLDDEIVVCNLGVPCRELFYLKDKIKTFYMLGSMGLVSSIALGVAIAKPDEKVWCIDGDGSLLMNLGSLSTVSNVNPKNMTWIVIDNGSYGSTGNQMTLTRLKTRLDEMARGAGIESIYYVNKKEEIIPTLKNMGLGCNFIIIKAEPGNVITKVIPLQAEEIRKRFMESIAK